MTSSFIAFIGTAIKSGRDATHAIEAGVRRG
jgi:hypothetical protein